MVFINTLLLFFVIVPTVMVYPMMGPIPVPDNPEVQVLGIDFEDVISTIELLNLNSNLLRQARKQANCQLVMALEKLDSGTADNLLDKANKDHADIDHED
ncbi:MAG TPA: hypothetical protein VHA52_00640 [Candidatus Babeliaceae bacterium]|nr:hypothetical protein [Candidatus Babeliaceae bacterium]